MRQEAINEANLTFFLQDRWHLALADCDHIHDLRPISANHSRLALLEAFLWLHLGVKLGYFPSALSRRVVYEGFAPVLEAYEQLLLTKQLDTWIPAPLRSIFTGEFGGDTQLFDGGTRDQQLSIERFTQPLSFFQSALILANGFAKNEKVRGLVKALSLADERTWLNALASDKLIPDLVPSKGEVELPSRDEWAVHGFCEFLRFMHAFRQIRDDAQEPSVSSGPAEFNVLVTLAQQVREIQQWRLNFGYPEPRERFLQVARSSLKMVLARTPTEESEESAWARLKKETLDLMRDWGAQLSVAATS